MVIGIDKFQFVEVRNIENILKNGKILLENGKSHFTYCNKKTPVLALPQVVDGARSTIEKEFFYGRKKVQEGAASPAL